MVELEESRQPAGALGLTSSEVRKNRVSDF